MSSILEPLPPTEREIILPASPEADRLARPADGGDAAASSSKSTAIERWDKTSTIGIGESTIQSIAQIDVMKPCGCREPRRIVGTCGVAGLFQSSASAISSFLRMKQVSFAPMSCTFTFTHVLTCVIAVGFTADAAEWSSHLRDINSAISASRRELQSR